MFITDEVDLQGTILSVNSTFIKNYFFVNIFETDGK